MQGSADAQGCDALLPDGNKADSKLAFSLTVGIFWKSMEGFPVESFSRFPSPPTQRLCVTCALCCCTADLQHPEECCHIQTLIEIKTQDARRKTNEK